MAIFCTIEVIDALKDMKFPKTKKEIILMAESVKNISEATNIALNKLEDKIYNSMDEICKNLKIVCSLEVRDALNNIEYPVTKSKIMEYAMKNKLSSLVIQSLEELPENITFNCISDICK